MTILNGAGANKQSADNSNSVGNIQLIILAENYRQYTFIVESFSISGKYLAMKMPNGKIAHYPLAEMIDYWVGGQ